MATPDSDPCATDFAAHTTHLFVDVAQASDIATGARPARRAVFRKTHGVVAARLILNADRPQELRQGIFASDGYDAWIRFSSDVAPTESDAGNGTIGVGIKLFGVSMPTLADSDPEAPTADLLLQNHDVFFVDTGHDMCVFTDLALKGQVQQWFAKHPETQQILAEMAKHEDSILNATYWSVLPFACGNLSVKYRLKSLNIVPTGTAESDPNRLRTDLALRLGAGPASFEFSIQVPNSGANLSVDRATQRWAETDAPFVAVGRLEIPQCDVTLEGQETYGETLSFNTWRVPAANRPLGTIAESRRLAYPASSAKRHYVNGAPDAEPHSPRSP